MRDIFKSDDEDDGGMAATTTLSHVRLYSESSSRSNDREEDGNYFNFFLSELSNCFRYVRIFPGAAAESFATSNHNPALRQSVLSVTALIAENDSEGEHTLALEHLQKHFN